MGNPNAVMTPGINNERNDVSVAKYFKGYVFLFQTAGAPPLLNLPPDFSSYGFNKSRKTFNNKETVFLPDVDVILNEYTVQRLQISFTAKFVELVNQQFFLFDFSLGNDKLEYAVNFYFKICNLPLVSSDDVRKTLSFYFETASGFGLPFMTPKQSGLAQLANSLPPLETKYFDRIKAVNYTFQKNPTKVGDERARWSRLPNYYQPKR